MGKRKPAFGGRGITTGDLAAAGLAALVVLALFGAIANRSRSLVLERRESDDRAVVATVAVGLSEDLDAASSAVADAAGLVAARGAEALQGTPIGASVPGFTGVVVLDASGQPASSTPLLGDGDLDARALRALLDRVRDSGDTGVGTATVTEVGPRVLFARALYAPSATGRPPASAPERRARHQGWVVAPFDAAASAASRLEEDEVASIDLDGIEFATGGLRGGLPSDRILVRDQPVVITAGRSDGVPISAVTSMTSLVGALAAVAAGAGVIATRRRLTDRRERAERADAQVHLIAEVAPVVQRSLDLADVLPVVAVQLTDHFGLTGIRLSTTSSASGTVELFRLGARPRIAPRPVLVPPDGLDAGEALALVLQRGGRTVAVLEVVAGRQLIDVDLQSLRVISELVTAAVVNAALYASQQDAVRRLRDLDALKTAFLGTASHELRTPATAIGGFAALLVRSWDHFSDEQRLEFAQRIAANARSLGAVVQDLLDFSLLDRAVQAPLLEPIDLGELVGSVIERLEPLVEHHTIDFSSVPAPAISGERNGLERVVTNLLTNAAKFSPQGTTVSLAVAPSGDGATVTVSDQGTGVPEEERSRIFTRFYRGSGQAVISTRGVGIGLSVVAELVERMHGSVSVGDAPGGGARFTVWLPPARDDGSGGTDEQEEEEVDAPRA